MKGIVSFLFEDEGASSIEYAFLASTIAIAAILGIAAVGTAISSTFSSVASSM